MSRLPRSFAVALPIFGVVVVAACSTSNHASGGSGASNLSSAAGGGGGSTGSTAGAAGAGDVSAAGATGAGTAGGGTSGSDAGARNGGTGGGGAGGADAIGGAGSSVGGSSGGAAGAPELADAGYVDPLNPDGGYQPPDWCDGGSIGSTGQEYAACSIPGPLCADKNGYVAHNTIDIVNKTCCIASDSPNSCAPEYFNGEVLTRWYCAPDPTSANPSAVIDNTLMMDATCHKAHFLNPGDNWAWCCPFPKKQ